MRTGVNAGESALTISALGHRWIAELLNHGRSPMTAKGYTYALRYFERWIIAVGIKPLELTREDVEQWLGEMRLGKFDPSTIRNRLMVVKELYRWLTALDYVRKDPFTYILAVKVPQKMPEVMTPNEIDVFVKACETKRETAIIETTYSTAGRRAGILGIRIPHLDFEAGQVKIVGKGGKELFCQLTPRAIRAIKAWLVVRAKYPCLQRQPTDILFIGRNGPLKSTQLAGIIHAIASRAGLNRRITPHTFRRSHATHLKDRDIPVEDIQQVLGHAKIQTTQLYVRASTKHLKRAWKALPRR